MSERHLSRGEQVEIDLALCADAIIALVDVYASPLVTLVKTLDHVIIATGATCPLRVEGKAGGAFDTAPIGSGLTPMPMVSFGPTLRITPYVSDQAASSEAVSWVHKKLDAIPRHLARKDDAMLAKLYGRLGQGIADAALKDSTKATLDRTASTSTAASDQLTEFLADAFAAVGGNDYNLNLPLGGDDAELPRMLLYYRQADHNGEVLTWLHDSQVQHPLLARMISSNSAVASRLMPALTRQHEIGPVTQTLHHGVCRWISLAEWREGHGIGERALGKRQWSGRQRSRHPDSHRRSALACVRRCVPQQHGACSARAAPLVLSFLSRSSADIDIDDPSAGRHPLRAERHSLVLAVEFVVPAPQFSAAGGHQQVEAIAVGELVGLGPRLGGADPGVGEHGRSPKSTSFFDRAYLVSAPAFRRTGMDGHRRSRPN